jgi:hypothetical protein
MWNYRTDDNQYAESINVWSDCAEDGQKTHGSARRDLWAGFP